MSLSAHAITGSTLTRAESRLIAAMSAGGSVGRHRRGLVVTGGSSITGSGSGLDRLSVRARGTGAGGAETEGGTM